MGYKVTTHCGAGNERAAQANRNAIGRNRISQRRAGVDAVHVVIVGLALPK